MSADLCRLPELLEIIFSYGDNSTVFACSLVCKVWLEPALNHLWRYIHDPLVLFHLLAPCKEVEVKDDTFTAVRNNVPLTHSIDYIDSVPSGCSRVSFTHPIGRDLITMLVVCGHSDILIQIQIPPSMSQCLQKLRVPVLD